MILPFCSNATAPPVTQVPGQQHSGELPPESHPHISGGSSTGLAEIANARETQETRDITRRNNKKSSFPTTIFRRDPPRPSGTDAGITKYKLGEMHPWVQNDNRNKGGDHRRALAPKRELLIREDPFLHSPPSPSIVHLVPTRPTCSATMNHDRLNWGGRKVLPASETKGNSILVGQSECENEEGMKRGAMAIFEQTFKHELYVQDIMEEVFISNCYENLAKRFRRMGGSEYAASWTSSIAIGGDTDRV